ncbi:hypothetical protein AQUCO_00100355v1 [Aquilegia coerulea]|uniref:Uncharacterized protein n=1 Tax=Aquilegia coerulea TaxID=218851 RepID=A0A2G5FA02_AQUCA|nr:hypothetical protein AQUCO_00100355v1 [Aquilegia coerulea]
MRRNQALRPALALSSMSEVTSKITQCIDILEQHFQKLSKHPYVNNDYSPPERPSTERITLRSTIQNRY